MTAITEALADRMTQYIRLRDIEQQMKELKEEREALLEELTPRGSIDFTYGDQHIVAKVVQRSRTVVNLPKLQMLDRRMYDRITKQVVDTAKLNRSLDSHEWDTELLDECITVVDDRPYIKFTDYLSAQPEDTE